MTDRLAEIEARLAKIEQLDEPHQIAPGLCSWSCADLEERDRLVEALIGDAPWLIAGVRALEAQAAAGKRVINAAAGVEANAVLCDDYDEYEYAYYQVRPRHMRELRAALAALDGEQKEGE